MRRKTVILSVLIFSLILGSCSIFKSSTDKKSYAINSFTYSYQKQKVWDALIKVLDEMNYKVKMSDSFDYSLTTEKTSLSKDDIETFNKLKEISEVSKSPLSEYFEANYYFVIVLTEDKNRTKVSIENKIQALERGRYNKMIDVKSNGEKEKTILSLLLKKLKEV